MATDGCRPLINVRLLALGLTVAVGACVDNSMAPSARAPTASSLGDFSAAVTCAVTVSAAPFSCGTAIPLAASGADPAAVTVGGQGTYVLLAGSNVHYDGSTTWQADVTVQNLLAQPMNTADGATADTGGVKVFFNSGPRVTGGTGAVSVLNADGTGTFTGTGQPFFTYSVGGVLGAGATTAATTWQFRVPNTVTSFAFTVYVTTQVPPAARLAFAVQPSNTAAGQVITPPVQVTIRDALGNLVITASNSVTLAIGTNPVGGTLAGTLTANAVNGVATFATLNLGKAGSGYTLAASAAGLTGTTSAPFTISGTATQLIFAVQPSNAVAGQTLTPGVEVTALDAQGNAALGFAGSVTLALGTNPRGGMLAGTLAETAVDGVASFANLSIDTAWTYTLVASSGTLPAASSAPFTIYAVGTGTGILYWGGPVLQAPKVAALYWSNSTIYTGGPTPGTSGAPATADQSLVGLLLRNLGGSPLFNILTTYYEGTNAFVQNVLSYSQYWADATAPDTAPSDAAVQAEIERGFTNARLTYDPSTVYVVFTGPGIDLGGGFLTQYCGYHSYFVDGSGRNVKYAAMPYDYAENNTAACFAQLASPNNDPGADAEVNILTHEVAEATSDPNLDAWYDAHGNEMADLCAWKFGNTYSANGAQANQLLGGKNFLVQMLWVDAETKDAPVGCQQNWSAIANAAARTALRPPAAAAPEGGLARRGPHIFPPRKR